jgi:pyrroloquinoline-quinone synthase
MTLAEFRKELESRIAKHDLLCHPFYQAWTRGQLTQQDLRAYATQYFHHVAAFPEYLEMLEVRLESDPRLAEAVSHNRAEEEGADSDGRSHAEMWLDFAEGMGADRAAVAGSVPLPEIEQLMSTFRDIAREGSTAEALAAFYAYESQVPRIAEEKARGLKDLYGADERTYSYFTHHQSADVYHSLVWSEQLEKQIAGPSEALQEKALDAAERVAQSLWTALDGIDRERLARAA